ncbi:DUF6770 family protein [Catalinimonas niigatensis]|uniref:DUF6770 family protein n=1 Tax=Catalinimonas niigatensis TaxID=1397264 RepID=UPI0026667D5C|nr:DUF6770 family protein [Catalinimonas niigatensis]WPP51142.1 DUF6770 family protein [Catalinimonas niigatensis]
MKTSTLFYCFCVSLIMFTKSPLLAQKKDFSDFLTVKLRNMGPIIKGNEVKGYYMFYQTDKIDRKTNVYQLRILDQNLNEVGNREIIESRYLTLLEGSFNEQSILLKFYDVKEKQLKFHQYDQLGKLITEKTVIVESKYDVATFNTEASSNEIQGTKLFAVPEKGFVHYNLTKSKKLGYSIDFIPENGFKSWTYTSDPESKEIEGASLATVTSEMILNVVAKKPSLLSKDATFYLMALDIRTGKKLFEKKMEDNQFSLQILNSFHDDLTGNTTLFGQYYAAEDKMFKSGSLGIFSVEIDKSGNLTSEKYISWFKDVTQFLPVNQKGKVDDMGYLYFHKIVRNKKGEVFAIAEQYRKAADGVGIAMAAMGASTSVVKMVIEDLVIFKFSPEFTLTDVDIFEKEKSSVSLPQGYSMVSTALMGHYLKSVGNFDYTFTQLSADKANLITGYVDYEKRKGEKNGWAFGAVSNTGSNYSLDKIALSVDASDVRVLPAKHGYVLISEYYANKKKLDLRLEKINY